MANYNLTQTGAEVQAILNSVSTIDAAPVENSTNPIQSGGIWSELHTHTISTDITPTTQKGYYYGSSGTNIIITSNSGSWYSGTITNTTTPPSNGVDISEYIGQTIRVTTSGATNTSSRITLIADSNNSILSKVEERNYTSDGNNSWHTDITIPNGAKWFFYSGIRSLVSAYIVESSLGIIDRLEALESSTSPDNKNFVSAVTSLEGAAIGQSFVLESKYIDPTDGHFVTSSNFNSRFINVKNAVKVFVKTQGLNSGAAIAFYGEKGITNFISSTPISAEDKEYLLSVPTNAFMLGVSFIKNYAPIIQVAQGSKTQIVRATDTMEMGDINISSSSYTYRYINTRARTLYKKPLKLTAGDKVFTDGDVQLYYAGNTEGGYVYGGWVTEIPVYHSGDYVFVARFTTGDAEPTDGDKSYITDHIYIVSDNAQSIIEDGKRILSPFNDWDRTIRSVNHRGYCTMAPENTLPAFKLSKEHGFGYIETDIFFTSDGHIVCIHDSTVDRTSDGSGNVTEMTLAQLKALDFGSWFSTTYAGTTIPTLTETLTLCHQIGIGCYIELKTTYTQSQAQQIWDEVCACGMCDNVRFISFALSPLQSVASVAKNTYLGWLGAVTQENINAMKALEVNGNKAFIDSSDKTSGTVSLCLSNDIPQEYWITEQEPQIVELPTSIVGVTSNHLVAGRILYFEGLAQ